MLNSSIIYRGIITSRFRTEKLYSFYKSIGDGKGQNSLYVSFGRSAPWSSNENEPGFAPPHPVDNVQGVVDTWTNMLGCVKVDRMMLDAVIPRKDWGDARFTNSRTFKIGEIVVVNTAPYNKSPGAKGWVVYRVVDVPNQGECSIRSIGEKQDCIKLGGQWTPGNESYTVPSGTGDTEGIIDTGDGYQWEYLYEIPADVSINRCTNEHIVVPFPEELSRNKEKWGYHNNLTWERDSFNLIYRLKVNTIRFKAYFDSVWFPDTSILGNKGFRQIAVIMNPAEKKVKASDPINRCVKPYYRIINLERHSGEMIYIENRPPIIRSMDQTEEVSLIFEF